MPPPADSDPGAAPQGTEAAAAQPGSAALQLPRFPEPPFTRADVATLVREERALLEAAVQNGLDLDAALGTLAEAQDAFLAGLAEAERDAFHGFYVAEMAAQNPDLRRRERLVLGAIYVLGVIAFAAVLFLLFTFTR